MLERETFVSAVPRGATVVHLVGTPHPSPSKAAEFEAVDFVSARECHAAALQANAGHFVYVSVAHPAPVPMYRLAELVPSKRETARRLGLVTLTQMIAALIYAVDTAAEESRAFDVRDIRRMTTLMSERGA